MSDIDISNLNPLSPEIIENQSTINIGTIGHVAHGKTSVIKAISGISTIKYKKELERNITIRLGYANAKIYQCPDCPPPSCYISDNSKIVPEFKCPHCGAICKLIRHVSFVDCPGHDVLMATMLNGTAVMDAALLLIAADEECPQPQTSEHLAAVEIMNMKNLIILQNKVDLVSKDSAADQYLKILNYISTTTARGSPVIPISANQKGNIDALLEYIVKTFPVPMRDYTAPVKMIVIRSFFVNKAGQDVRSLTGGVAGGSILQGYLKLGDEVEIRPGVFEKDSNGMCCRIRKSRVVSLKADENPLKFAVPGGLIGVGLTLDPSLCRQDRLAGQVLGRPGTLPDIYITLTVQFNLFKRLLGVVEKDKVTKIAPLSNQEVLYLNVGSTSIGAFVVGLANIPNTPASEAGTKGFAVFKLDSPACTSIGERIAISRQFENWRLIGWAKIIDGTIVPTKE